MIVEALGRLRQLPVAVDSEVLAFVEKASLAGCGIGYVDAHLIVSAKLGRGKLWTRDKRLHRIAVSLGISHD